MTTLNFEKFIKETKQNVSRRINVATARLRVSQIPPKFLVKATYSDFTGANNNWFTVWAPDTVRDLN